MIKFVSDLRQAGYFFPGIPVSSTNQSAHYYIAEILLKVALNTISQLNQRKNHVEFNMLFTKRTKGRKCKTYSNFPDNQMALNIAKVKIKTIIQL